MTNYGPGGPPATPTPSGQSILDGNYVMRNPMPVVLQLPAQVPITAYKSPAAFPAGVGPTSVNPPGPLGPLAQPHIWPDVVSTS